MKKETKYTDDHYKRWLESYYPYLQTLWIRYCKFVKDDLKIGTNCTFKQFIDFVYRSSTGKIQ
jgi:hypothetical protein